MPGTTDPKGSASQNILVKSVDLQDKGYLGSCTERSRDSWGKNIRKTEGIGYETLRSHKLLEQNMREFLNIFGVERTFLTMTQKPEVIKVVRVR